MTEIGTPRAQHEATQRLLYEIRKYMKENYISESRWIASSRVRGWCHFTTGLMIEKRR